MSIPLGAQTGFGNVSEGQGAPGRKRWRPTRPMTPSEIANLFDIADPSTLTGPSRNNVWGSADMYSGAYTAPVTMRDMAYRGTMSSAERDALAASGGTAGGRLRGDLNNPFSTASVADGGGGKAAAGTPGGTTSGTDTAAFQFRGSDKAYSPSDIAAMLANPALFQSEYLAGLGINTPTAAGAMGDYYRIIPYLAQFFLAQNTPSGGVSDADRQAGIYEDLLQNYTTPGGRSADLGEILTALFNAGQPGSGELPANMLQANYANMAPDDQIKAVNNLLNAAIAGQPGGYGDALSNLFAQAAMLYQQSNLNANNGSATNNIPDTAYYEWLQTQPIFRQIAGY